MANRTFQEKHFGLVKREVHLYCKVSVGAAGAVTLKKRSFANGSYTEGDAPTTGTGYTVGNGEGVRSVTRTAAGTWTITLSDAYVYYIGLQLVRVFNASGVVTTAQVGANNAVTNVSTNTGTGNGGTVGAVLLDFTGAAADPADGDSITLVITLGDATEP